ncbi:hypothetical protein AK812_SmicGene1975 [Symbiodinium microadriaticum]|uniref:Uncharacterized protein n=1 Tax=Symbiodinium microadriaticum TaxID=2951 RepID=A0A1Q9F2X1_SYMMI|nr:hypothetical protein AK812_SmicGene1975 [Symbiodinium microadriaticum]
MPECGSSTAAKGSCQGGFLQAASREPSPAPPVHGDGAGGSTDAALAQGVLTELFEGDLVNSDSLIPPPSRSK